MFIIYFIIILFLIILTITLSSSMRHGAPYVPSSKSSIRYMLKIANLKPDELLLDMGSGDGRVLVVGVEEFGARGLGIEITWFYYVWSLIKIKLKGLSNRIIIRREDMYKSDVSQADVVVMFLLQDTNQKLKDKLQQELKPGTRIVSHYFTFDNWEPVQKDLEHYIYLYVVPEK